MTLQEKICTRLLAGNDWKEVTSSSKKYRKFVWGDKTYWVGKNGAVRAGKTISGSYSITHMLAKDLRGNHV